jgi:predicted RNA polymerase sigma factor
MAGSPASPVNAEDSRAAAARAARDSYGRLVALLATSTRDVALAEDALSDAFERALLTWPATGVPENPQGWLVTVARNRIRDAGIPFRVPTRTDMPARLPAVLEAIYGAYAIDWLDPHERIRESIADEARWLAVLTATLLGTEPEAWGLAALITFAQSRAPARTSTPWPPLDEQDTTLWDRSLIAVGEALLRRAHALGAPLGRFQLEAAIQSAHCDRARTGILDRATLVKLYRGLVAIAPTAGAVEALAAVTAET